MTEEKNAVREVHVLQEGSVRLFSLTQLSPRSPGSVVVVPLEWLSEPTDDGSSGQLVTGERLVDQLSEEEWNEAIIAAMKKSAEQRFVAPEQHLSSIRALIQRATARDV